MNIKKYIDAEWKDEHDGYRYLRAYNKDIHPKDIPVLLVGLGGSGIQALQSFKNKAESIYRPENCTNLEYLAIDTDDIAEDANILPRDRIIIQSADTAMFLREARRDNGLIPDEIKSWLDTRISPFKVMNGAAGIRQAGRLILFLNIHQVYQALQRKIEKIRIGYDLSKTRIQVYIFTGIGGGTGSGMFVDISYLIRNICPNAEINGIIIMPDVSCKKPGIREVTKSNIKRNGFAALKELEYLMMLRRYDERFCQKYPGNIGIIDTQDPIFDYCILVGSKEAGRNATPSEAEIYERIAEYVLTELQTKIVGAYSIESFKSNLSCQNDETECFFERYVAIGAKTEYVPTDYYYSWWLGDVIDSFLQNIQLDLNTQDKTWVADFKKNMERWVDTVFSEKRDKLRKGGETKKYNIHVLEEELKISLENEAIANVEKTKIIEYCLQNPDFLAEFKNEITKFCDEVYSKRNILKRIENGIKNELGKLYLKEFLDVYKTESNTDTEKMGELVELLKTIQIKTKQYKKSRIGCTGLFSIEAFEAQQKTEEYKVSVQNAEKKLVQNFRTNYEKWTGQTVGTKINWLSDYIAEILDPYFENSGCRSVFRLLDHYQDGEQMKIVYLEKMFNKLDETRQLWPTADTSIATYHIYDIFVAPKTEELGEIAKRWSEEKNVNINIAKSDIDERFSKILFVPGYSMYTYEDLPDFENEYNRQKNKYGVHLYAVKGKDWSKLPSPYFETKWREKDVATRKEEALRNAEYRNVFDVAVENGIIVFGLDGIDVFGFKVDNNGQIVQNPKDSGVAQNRIVRIGDIERQGEDMGAYYALAQNMFIHMFTYRDMVKEYVER